MDNDFDIGPVRAYARSAGLLYVSDAKPGIRRQRAGRGFKYLTPRNRRVTDQRQLSRIARLAVPPAYRSVWICPEPRGHLQATGRDARGRKQYRYHPTWEQLRDAAKFERVIEFGEALPKLLRRLKNDLSLSGLPREKVLAVVVSLLDTTRARIGNAEYARTNHSFGITTLRNRHVTFTSGGRAVLDFRGKGGVRHEIVVDDRRVAQIVRRCQELPGQHLFQYLDQEGRRCPIDSGQVNDYLRDIMGAAFTAKDFRTWSATLNAIALLASAPLPHDATEKFIRDAVTSVVKSVAHELRNTPAVCRKSYIDPDLFESWRTGSLARSFPRGLNLGSRSAERTVIRFLRRRKRASGHAVAVTQTSRQRK